jgi:hypothetical protein
LEIAPTPIGLGMSAFKVTSKKIGYPKANPKIKAAFTSKKVTSFVEYCGKPLHLGDTWRSSLIPFYQ